MRFSSSYTISNSVATIPRSARPVRCDVLDWKLSRSLPAADMQPDAVAAVKVGKEAEEIASAD
jgi:hypothetical protein